MAGEPIQPEARAESLPGLDAGDGARFDHVTQDGTI